MWSYYELTTEQVHADRLNAAGYAVPASAKREYPEDAIGRVLARRRQVENGEKREARRIMLATVIGAIKTVLRGPTVVR